MISLGFQLLAFKGLAKQTSHLLPLTSGGEGMEWLVDVKREAEI